MRKNHQMFDLDRFIDECKAAVKEDPTQKATHDIVARAVRDSASVVAALGEPTRAGVQTLYHAPDLTILNLVWGPHMTLHPHNHDMWAVIGMYGGREDNVFWRRLSDCIDGTIEAAGAKSLSTGDCTPLGKDIIHSVTNPVMKLSGGLHVYGGDFFGAHRSEWCPEVLTEREMDVQASVALFEAANERLGVH
jgi:predicted metal-dependent enzyme (double-stranded beta helix superfamily)